MSQEKGRLGSKLVIWPVLFALGFASGFLVRDRQHHRQVEEALAKGRAEALATLDRSVRAGKKLQAGTRAAAKELMGTSEEEAGKP
ncbi:MAG: hypothetical protein ABFS46_05125 [Myxococcota bacterium]